MPRSKTLAKTVDIDILIGAATEAVKSAFKDEDVRIEHGEDALVNPRNWCSTGSLALDFIIRGLLPGGIPMGPEQGRIVHIYGLWSTGKSVLLDHMVHGYQKAGGIPHVSETEGSRDPHFAEAIGLDLSRVTITRPRTIELAIDGFLKWHDAIRAKERKAKAAYRPILWGLDSLDSTEANKSADKGLSEGGGWQFGGGRSQALGAGLRKVVQRCSRYPTSVVMLNQTRINVGVMFGDKTTTSGGQGPHFYASVELSIKPSPRGVVRAAYKGQKLNKALAKRRGLPVESKGDVVAAWNRIKVAKSKVSGTYLKECDFLVHFQLGVDRIAGLFDVLMREGITGFEGEKSKRVWMKTPERKRRWYDTETDWEQAMLADEKFLAAAIKANVDAALSTPTKKKAA